MIRTKLKNWLGWQPQPAEFLALLRPVKPWPVQMDQFSRGIDNTHIDIYLSPRFVSTSQTLVQAMINYDLCTQYWNESGAQPSPADLDGFRDAYRGIVESAMKQRQQAPPADWVRLVQLSLLKYLLQLVPEEIQCMRRDLERRRDEKQATETGRHLEFHERLVVLVREEGAVAYRVYSRLFKLLDKQETGILRKLRKSLLGVSWPLPREVLFNPLLQLPNLLDSSEVIHHYPLLCVEDQGKAYLNSLNQSIAEVFRDYLPTWTHLGRPEAEGAGNREQGLRVMDRLDQGGLRGFLDTEIVLSQLLSKDEYKIPQYSWLDDPDNLMHLVDEAHNPADKRGDERALKHWKHFKQIVRNALEQRIERLGLVARVVASYWTPRIHQELAGKVPAKLIYEYLVGELNKRKLLRRLSSGPAGVDPTLVTKTLDFATGEIKQLTAAGRQEYIVRLFKDFLSLRRDLKLAYKTFEAMDRLRILGSEEDINLSRANGLLYEFRLAEERTAERRIRSHVIIKADLRGSTRITAELRAKKLNPATHFSQNFFNPINKHLSNFGAKKVFVEGDAVILSFLEQSGGSKRSLTVAHACGMAGRILEVVARQNALNRRHGLPDLELGLGIAYCDEEPTFLYDEDRQIMISPAINLADRLSSCAKALRDSEFSNPGRPFRVEVLAPEDGSEALAASKADVIRFNVNGIELDAEGFVKLRSELMLHRMDVSVAGRPERFFVARYPDRGGRLNWLVVRESPLHLWDAGKPTDKPIAGRWFYEVIVDQGLITLIRSKLRSAKEAVVKSKRSKFGNTSVEKADLAAKNSLTGR